MSQRVEEAHPLAEHPVGVELSERAHPVNKAKGSWVFSSPSYETFYFVLNFKRPILNHEMFA